MGLFPAPLCFSTVLNRCVDAHKSVLHLLVVIVGWLLPLLVSGQTTYYVSSTGNDANTGLSPTAPLQTIGKVNGLVLKAGDAILFRRGETFRGTLTIRQTATTEKPIRIDAYGTGERPIISGAMPLANWTSLGNNRWQASFPEGGSRITGVYRNGLALPMGRFPNASQASKGYMTIQSHVGKTQLTSQQPLTTDWTGAEAVVRPVQWILDRATITSQSGNTLTLANTSTYSLADKWGYFIQNHPATLDQDGEWYYNPVTRTLLLYLTTNPNTATFTATAFDEALLVTGAYVTIQNLHVTQARATNLRATNATGLVIDNLYVSNGGEDGIRLEGSGSNAIIQNTTVDRINNNGISTSAYQNVVVRRNTIRNVGLVAGRGKSGDGQSVGILSGGAGGLLLEENVLDSLGFNGICFVDNAVIQRNIISNFCLTKSDGGGIYVWNGNKQPMGGNRILSNIIYGGTGAADGTPGGAYTGANGIYLDDCSANIDVKANTVFGCAGLGIFLHATNNTNLSGNTSYDNDEGQFKITHNNGGCPARANTVSNNLFFSKLPTQTVAAYESLADDLSSYGTFDNNIYARPFDDLVKIRAVKSTNGTVGGSDLTLSQWQALSGQDRASLNSPVTYRNYTIGQINKTLLNQTFSTGNEDWSVWGPNNNAQAVRDNSAKLDGGSLRVGFTSASGNPNSYLYAFTNVGAVTVGKQYLLQFDAVGSGAGQTIPFFLRQREGGYQDVSNRATVWIGPGRQHYELAFTATTTEAKTLLITQLMENGQTLWLDNVGLREASLTSANPADSIRIAYNPTSRDSLIQLGNLYKNEWGASQATAIQTITPVSSVQTSSVQVSPFSSVVLMRNTALPTSPASVDLSMAVYPKTRISRVDGQQTVTVVLHNDGTTHLPGRVQWTCRLPPSLSLVSAPGLTYQNGLLTGTAQQLSAGSDTTFTFAVRPQQAGQYRIAAQISYSPLSDPDSSPNSGTADGEDDTAVADFRAMGTGTETTADEPYASPNPNQVPLPAVVTNQPIADPAYTDLALLSCADRQVASVGSVISLSLTLANTGGRATGPVSLQYTLPTGLQFIDGSGWNQTSGTLTTTLANIAAGDRPTVSFRVRITQPGSWIGKGQILTCQAPDIDSTPGNGYTNGEDDQSQISLRTF